MISHTVEIHSNNVVGSSTCQKIRDQSTGLGDPLAVPNLRLEGWRFCNGGLACQSTGRLGTIRTIDAIGGMVSAKVRTLVSLGRIKRISALDAIRLDGA